MTELIVGCPIYKREWILPYWLINVEAAAQRLGIIPSYVFVGDPRDLAVIDVIDQAMLEDRTVKFVWFAESEDREDLRSWNSLRYHHMVELRNTLLRAVRRIAPTYFLSLDSDILLHAQALADLMESIERFDAVGGKAYLSTGRVCPTYAQLPANGGLLRTDAEGVFPVDCIMAIKLMTARAYNVDYEYHQQGEDAGWSVACRRNGIRLGWDGRTTNKHVMERELLLSVDKRCGY